MQTGVLRNTPRPLILASALFFAAAYFPTHFAGLPGAQIGSYASTFFIALPAGIALFKYLGWGRAAPVLLVLSAYAYTVEAIGLATGFPYGVFYYGEALGPKAFGIVPYLLPVSYVPLVIGAFAAAWGIRNRVLHVLAAALLVTLIDGVLDPGAVSLGFWVWPDGGPYYGVPVSNYLGWLLSGALASALLLVTGRWKAPPLPGLLDSSIIAVSFWTGIAVYALLLLPALLGITLFVYLLYRRSLLSRADGYKLRDG